jgi:hypothetical protein
VAAAGGLTAPAQRSQDAIRACLVLQYARPRQSSLATVSRPPRRFLNWSIHCALSRQRITRQLSFSGIAGYASARCDGKSLCRAMQGGRRVTHGNGARKQACAATSGSAGLHASNIQTGGTSPTAGSTRAEACSDNYCCTGSGACTRTGSDQGRRNSRGWAIRG